MIKKLDYIIKPMQYNDLFNIHNIKNMNEKNICGIYFLANNEKVVYVGQSANLISRIIAHSNKKYDSVYYFECKKEELDKLETHYIVAFNPKYNKTHESMITLNKFRLNNTKLNKYEKHVIGHHTSNDACKYLRLIEGIPYGEYYD